MTIRRGRKSTNKTMDRKRGASPEGGWDLNCAESEGISTKMGERFKVF